MLLRHCCWCERGLRKWISGQKILTKGRIARHVVIRTEWSLLLRALQQRLPILFSGPSNPQNCSFQWGISTPYNTWFARPTWVSPKTASRSIQPLLHSAIVWPTYRHTDHATCDICSNRPHRYVHAMRPKIRPEHVVDGTSRRLNTRCCWRWRQRRTRKQIITVAANRTQHLRIPTGHCRSCITYA